jgi:hypothetical protein
MADAAHEKIVYEATELQATNEDIEKNTLDIFDKSRPLGNRAVFEKHRENLIQVFF